MSANNKLPPTFELDQREYENEHVTSFENIDEDYWKFLESDLDRE